MFKISIIIQIIILLQSIKVNAQSDNFKKDSVEFSDFLSNFPIVELKKKYNLLVMPNNRVQISSYYLKKYICDICNDCDNEYTLDFTKYLYIEQYHSESFYILLYEKFLALSPGHSQVIMATYSKADMKVISKIKLVGFQQLNYFLTSTFNDSIIETTKVISSERSQIKPNPNYPEYFWITEVIERYKLTKKGVFTFEETLPPKEFIARLGESDEQVYEYPVELPKN